MADKAQDKPPVGRMAAGRITTICGCMFSGKSERLVDVVRSAQAAGRRVAAFKHASDDRYTAKHIVTHSGQRVAATPVANADGLLRAVGLADLIVIDEAQFFSEDLSAACRALAAEGRDVIVAGLDLDSWGQPFGAMPALEAIADEVVRTLGTCAHCGRPADHTQRLAPVAEPVTERTMIGGPESYEPRCAECFVPLPIELRR